MDKGLTLHNYINFMIDIAIIKIVGFKLQNTSKL